MTSRIEVVPPIPEDTARIARYPVREGSFYRSIGDRLLALTEDIELGDLYDEESPVPPATLALVTVFQFMEGLTDPQAVAAMRRRIDWKYALHLPLAYPGFDHQLLADFRERLLASRTAKQELERLLVRLRDLGMSFHRSRATVSAFYLITSVRTLNRLMLVRRAMCLAIEAITSCQPEWSRAVLRPHWAERYVRSQSGFRPPTDPEKGEALAAAIGSDGEILLRAIGRSDAPRTLSRLPEIELLRHVWRWQFEEKKPAIRAVPVASGRAHGRGAEAN